TVTQSSSQTITVGSSGWTQSSGNFAGSDANISVTGDVSVSGGSLTSTSTTFTAGNNLTLASGTLIPNGGTIELYSTPALHSCSVTLNTGTNALNHFKINRNNGGSCGSIVTTTGTVTINGNMDIYNIGLPGSTSALNGGQFDVSGNVDMTMNYSGGSSIIQFNGTGNQTISQSAGVYPSIKINKTSGTLTLPSAVLKLSSDWTHLAGTVDTSGNTIQFAQISSGVGSTSTITTTGMSFNHLELVKNRAGSNTSISGTITVLGNMTVNNVTAGASDRISGGTINVLGNLTMLASTGGSATLQIVGTGAQTLSGTGGNLPNLLVNKPSGTLTISGIVGLAGNLTHTAGTVVSTGSTFIRTSAPNLSQCSSTITPNTMEFDNFYFNSTCGGGGPTTDTISGTLVVNGTLTINNSGPSGLDVINGGSISAKGNISMTAGDSGTTNIILSGTGTQNITHSGGTFPGSVLTLNKPSGSAHLSSHLNLSVSGQDLTLNSGSLYMGGYNLTINDRLTLDSGTSLFTECGTLSYGALTNNGTIVNGSDVLLSVNDVTVNEGNNAVFSIALSGASCSDVTFNYATSNGTAIAGTHYTSTSGSQTLTAGSTTLNITVPTLDDSCYSGSSKAMSLTLSSITGTGVLDNVGVGTIDDLATKPTVQFTSTGSTVAESVGTVTITAQRTGASCSATSVPYNISGTATSGSDYTITASPLTIAAGASGLSATSTVTVSDDSTLEATETVILDLQTMTNADIGTNSTYTLNITDNDLGAFSISGIQGSNGIDTTNDAYLSQDTHAVVSWSSSVGATSYNVLIYQDDGATIQCAQQNTTSTSYDFSSCNLTGGTYYRASVTATDGTSSGPASNNTYRFYVNQNPVATSTGPWYVMSTSSININALYAAPPSVGIASDSDSGQTLTFTSANNGTYGTVTNNSTYITYTPSSSTSTGADSFSVTINDGVGGSLTTTINIYVVTAFTWTGNTNNTWSSGTASNWCGSINSNKNGCTGTGSVPGASDVAVIDSTCSSGNCTPTTNYNVSVAGIRANGLTLNQGVGFTFTLGTTGWIQNGGVFNGSNSNITTAAFTINAGSFTSTSGTLAVYRASTGNETYFKVDSSASFLPNNGTVKISSGCWNCNYTSTLDVADGFNFYNLSLTKVAGGGAGATYQPITGRKIIILNNFSHGSDEYVDPVISLSGTWEVQGNFYVKGEAKGGTGTITLNGTGNQSYDTTNSGISVNLVINKASGNVTPSGTELNIGSFDLQSGTFTAPTGTFYIKHYAASASVTLFKIAATATYNHNNGTLLLKTANSGCFCPTTTTVDVPDAFQFYNVTVSQHNANFGTTTAPVTGRKIVVLNNFSHGSDDFVGAANTLLSGNWEVQGNLYVKAEANGGSGTITLNGTGNQSYSTTNSGVTANVVVNKTSGTVTPLSSEFNINSFDLQSGTFTAPTSTFYIKHFAPSASVTMFKIAATATYNHNNGTLLLKTANSGCFCPTTTTVDVPDAFQFYNVTVSQHNANFGTTTAPVTGRKIVVLNNFSHGSDDFVGAANTLLSGNWEVQGNLYVKAEANRGTGNITFTGSGSQTYTRTNGTPTTGTWTVNKSGGSLQLLSNLTLNDATQDLTISAGTLDMNGYNLTLGRNITNNDTLKRGNSPSCGTITQGGSYTGNAAICP
ncbi:MAG: hypothetical protein K1X29_00005, partial [Bdellovibrionales bacterium]|nr:hypothetical protein [Bdellovibrionales bacterium]